MNKLEFIDILKQKLSLLPQNELDERINFYSEIIDDYIEDGISEEDAVSKLGSIDDVVSEVLKDTSILKLAKNKFKPKTKLEPWVILLIILSFYTPWSSFYKFSNFPWEFEQCFWISFTQSDYFIHCNCK